MAGGKYVPIHASFGFRGKYWSGDEPAFALREGENPPPKAHFAEVEKAPVKSNASTPETSGKGILDRPADTAHVGSGLVQITEQKKSQKATMPSAAKDN